MLIFPRRFSLAFFALSIFALCGCGSRADVGSTPGAQPQVAIVKTALDTYIARDEPAYKWEKISEKKIGTNNVTTLNVTSQTWQGIEWKHRVEIARPDKIEFPGWAMMYLSTGDGLLESLLTQTLATKLGAVTIHVMGMPNQPLFGLREDALIAHTFAKTIETGDQTWPLLLPMTKGAVKAMDAVQEYSRQQDKPLEKFVVVGASKRGWTTWLVGATDTKKRVAGIIPLVYDNLNLEKQMPHQLESWGKYSPMIEDYTRIGLQAQLSTARGKELSQSVDPFTYRARLTMPKLIINATNDPYWTLDSLNLYWNDLPGPKNVYYAPNVGHSLEGDWENAFGTAGVWFRSIAGGKEIPKVELEKQGTMAFAGAFVPMIISVAENAPVKSVQFWVARSKTRDFRQAEWKAEAPRKPSSKKGITKYPFSLKLPRDQSEYTAVFATVSFEGETPLRISTPVSIYKGRDEVTAFPKRASQ